MVRETLRITGAALRLSGLVLCGSGRVLRARWVAEPRMVLNMIVSLFWLLPGFASLTKGKLGVRCRKQSVSGSVMEFGGRKYHLRLHSWL